MKVLGVLSHVEEVDLLLKLFDEVYGSSDDGCLVTLQYLARQDKNFKYLNLIS